MIDGAAIFPEACVAWSQLEVNLPQGPYSGCPLSPFKQAQGAEGRVRDTSAQRAPPKGDHVVTREVSMLGI